MSWVSYDGDGIGEERHEGEEGEEGGVHDARRRLQSHPFIDHHEHRRVVEEEDYREDENDRKRDEPTTHFGGRCGDSGGAAAVGVFGEIRFDGGRRRRRRRRPRPEVGRGRGRESAEWKRATGQRREENGAGAVK